MFAVLTYRLYCYTLNFTHTIITVVVIVVNFIVIIKHIHMVERFFFKQVCSARVDVLIAVCSRARKQDKLPDDGRLSLPLPFSSRPPHNMTF